MRGLALLLCALILAGAFADKLPIKVPAPGSLNGIKHEAEDAFKYVKQTVTSCNVNGAKVSGDYTLLSAESYIIFTVNIPSDGVYPVTLFAFSCGTEETSLDISANGIQLFEKSALVRTAHVQATYELTLRTGLNTIMYTIHGADVAFDFVVVKGGIPLAVRGATLDYEEIEAEDSAYQGTLIGPGRAYTTIPSEASGRKAVQLTKQGDYVEFSPTLAFNAFVVRFSIPDTSNGAGQAALLNVIINGKQTTELNVTSYWSHVYGPYPGSKTPGDGNPHHFFDDVRYFFKGSSLPAGTKVRLVGVSTSIPYTIDLADFYNVGAPYPRPANYLSVADFGADPSGKNDNVIAFNSAIAAAQKAGQGVWIPEGTFTFSTRITVNKVTVRGAGPWYSECHGYDFGFFGTWAPNPSVGVQLYDFAVFGRTRTRVDSEVSSGAGGSFTNSQIQNIWIEHNKCGMWLDGPFDSLLITGVTIRNTFADGINFHQGITNSVVQQSKIRNVGDDALAMWAEVPGAYHSNTFKFNTLALPVLANLIAIYGGSDNSATDNLVIDNIVEGAGLQTGTRFNSVSLGGTTLFARNTLIRCGGPDMYDPHSAGEGAIWLYADGGNIDSLVIFDDITIQDAYYQAVMLYQGQPTNMNFTNIKIDGVKYVWEERVTGSIYAQGVVATNVAVAGIWNCGIPFTIIQGPGNSGWNSTKCV